MKTTDQGLTLIMEREGVRNAAYLDSEGIPTIGVGHTGPDVQLGIVWTDEQVMDALRRDMAVAEAAIAQNVTVALEPYQGDALASFIVNVGVSAFVHSTLLRLLNAGDYSGAAAQFDRWHIPPEIATRRNAEREQFKGLRFEARIA